MIIQFGKYKGTPITEVPKDYLKYLLKWDKLKADMRDAIEKVMAGAYIDPNSKRQPYDPAMLTTAKGETPDPHQPPDFHDRLSKARKDGARWALSDAATEIDGLDVPALYKSQVLQALLAVAQRLQS